MLGLSPEYQTLARWYFQSGGLDFLSYLSAFYPHLSTDASLLALLSFSLLSARLLPLFHFLLLFLLRGLALQFLLLRLPFLSLRLLLLPLNLFLLLLVFLRLLLLPLSAALGASAVRSTVGVSSALAFPPVSAPSSLPSHPPAPPSSSLSSWGPFASQAPAPVVSAAPAVPVCRKDLPDLSLFTDASDTGWGASLGEDHLSGSWSPLSSRFSISHRELLAVFFAVRGFLPSSPWSGGGSVLRQHHSPGVSQEAGWHSFFHAQHGGTVSAPLVRGLSDSPPAPVHPEPVECPHQLPEPQGPSHRLRVDPLLRGLSSASSPVACHHRSLRYIPQHSASTVFFTDGGSAVGRHRCPASELGRSPGSCLPSFRPPFSGAGEGLAISGTGAHLGGSILASAPVVPASSGAYGGGSLLPATKEGSAQTAPLPSLSPEPPRASADCLAYIQRSARHSGFSSAVARQLALCHRRSTRVNYQAKWTVYPSWCCRHGHSISRPSVKKVADFLLYLRRSLSLSYSSIASYRSMLSGVFRFILFELSSHFVLHDLLRSFRLECPPPLSRVPPWDLIWVLRFLRGPPFEPHSSCSLHDLTQKVLFLVSLATARRVGELQAVSRDRSFWLRSLLILPSGVSGEDRVFGQSVSSILLC